MRSILATLVFAITMFICCFDRDSDDTEVVETGDLIRIKWLWELIEADFFSNVFLGLLGLLKD